MTRWSGPWLVLLQIYGTESGVYYRHREKIGIGS